MTACWPRSFTLGVCFLLLMVLVGLASPATAADSAKVRSRLKTDQSVWVGQRVGFHVDLLSATFFSGTPKFSLPSLPGAVLLKIEARPVLSTEQIDGDTYSVQRHTFAVFPQKPGQMLIPAFQVQFAVAPAFGQPPVEQTLMTTQLRVEADMPPGAEAVSMLISTTDLHITCPTNSGT